MRNTLRNTLGNILGNTLRNALRNTLRNTLVICLLFLFIAQPLRAAYADQISTDQILLESKADRTQVTVGDPIHYSITANMQKGVVIAWPQSGSNLGDFDILDHQVTGATKKEGRIIQTLTYTLAAYDTGVFPVPPVKISYKTPEGEEKSISAQGIEIKVNVVAPEKASDIKDIKGPLDMERNWAHYRKPLLWVMSILVLALLFFWIWWWFSKRKKTPLVQDAEPLLVPAHEAAFAELKKIWDTFLKNKQIREFYFQLSETVRQYLSRRYQINALEATTEELIRTLKEQPIHFQQRTMVTEFLNGCDLVKFAKYAPHMTETEQLYQMAFQIVDTTRIIESNETTTVLEASPDVRQTQQE